MKTYIITRYTAFVFVVATLMSACKNDTEDKPSTNGKLAFHLHAAIGDNKVETYGDIFEDEDGRKMKLTLAQFYLSEIELVKTDGSIYKSEGVRILKTQEEDAFEIGEVPAGNYQSVRFKVGLVPAINMLMPSASPDSVILNRSEMWFGSTAQPEGYVFMRVQGAIDTSSQKTGITLQPFDIKIGTNAHLIEVKMPDRKFSVLPGSTTFVHMETDYSRLFTGIAINNPGNLTLTTTSANTSTLAAQLATNIAAMFEFEE